MKSEVLWKIMKFKILKQAVCLWKVLEIFLENSKRVLNDLKNIKDDEKTEKSHKNEDFTDRLI